MDNERPVWYFFPFFLSLPKTKRENHMTNLLLLGFLPSGSEWIIIVFIILLLFGGKKIPELMKGLGKGVKSFKEGVNEAKEEINKAQEDLNEPVKDKK